jgi:hypothetical protein
VSGSLCAVNWMGTLFFRASGSRPFTTLRIHAVVRTDPSAGSLLAIVINLAQIDSVPPHRDLDFRTDAHHKIAFSHTRSRAKSLLRRPRSPLARLLADLVLGARGVSRYERLLCGRRVRIPHRLYVTRYCSM